MLSYQHGYHAGNFADVVKHLTLSRVIDYMGQKDKPLLYLETHSGRGLYDLHDGQAGKTSEYRQGVSLLWEQRTKLPDLMTPWLSVLKNLNPKGELRYYPGSPHLALSLLRSQDRAVFAERHPREFEQLEQLPRQGRRVQFRHADGIREMQADLPPIERRALTFLDPSYEIKDEYKTIPRAIQAAFSRFSTGVYCLWYPVVDRRLRDQLVRGMMAIPTERTLRIEFYLTGAAQTGMTGCGLWLINPPHTLAAEMRIILDNLRTLFNPGVSYYLIEEGRQISLPR
ncbi:23S rRNA (adenine(2030)-N(6))-methyltransferase RlmJ [Legionella sp. CNM-4043-24]|uniref:23S rRNA (adenine(2030)-N(6))-methyltransferase RlmJ n=1 Tax=Legionella sp. CNM-4043-24 TaxID=3421646 RepID=UPI00403AEFCA